MALSILGETADNAQALYGAYEDMRESETADGEKNSSLCVQYPLARLLVSAEKRVELRRCEISADKLGQTIFLSESGTKLDFDISTKAKAMAGERTTGHIIGTIKVVTCRWLVEEDLTDELAGLAMLTLVGLKRSWNKGYRCAWDIGACNEFKTSIPAATLYANRTGRPGTIYTNTTSAPLKREISAVSLAASASGKRKKM